MKEKTNRKVSDCIDYNLRIPKLYKKTWIHILWISFVLLLLAAIPLIAIYAPKDETIINAIRVNSGLKTAGCVLSYLAFIFITMPYIFLSACWIVGIDNITKSKNFHLFLWFAYSLAAFLSLIAIIISFRAYLIV